MLYTLAHAKELVAPHVTPGGACPDDAVVVDRINEAQRRLLMVPDAANTLRHVRVCTANCCIALPREFESARLVSIDYGFANLFPMTYQYLEHGPGFTQNPSVGKNLLDLGDGFPTFFDPPEDRARSFFLFAASRDPDLPPKQIKIYGRADDGSELYEDLNTRGLNLPIATWDNQIEGKLVGYPVCHATPVRAITQVVLPADRKTYVSLYAVDPDTHEMFFLSRYHPAETHPAYRRYRILNCVGGGHCKSTVQILAKVRHVPLVEGNDVLAIQNLDAIKLMVMAIRFENSAEVQAAVTHESRAVAYLKQQVANQRSGDPILGVQDQFSLGQIPNII